MYTVLILDEDPDGRDLLAFVVQRAGMQALIPSHIAGVLECVVSRRPDLLVMDLCLRGHNPFELMRQIRRASDVPIVVLTARASEDDVVQAFEAGAHDFVEKPYSVRPLLARLRSILTRSGRLPPRLEVAGVTLDPETHTLSHGDGPAVHLTPTETHLLEILFTNTGQTVASETLVRRVWSVEGDGDTTLLKPVVSRLRRKLETCRGNPLLISAIPHVGYRLTVAAPAAEDLGVQAVARPIALYRP